jgi:2,3-bisphosphoglycerate-independent phosphoglycerate mutase
MDRIAACRIGTVRTIPQGLEPGSDVANLSLLGYDPGIYHTGRAPLEAASMGIQLRKEDVAFRMNLVTLERRSDQDVRMVSHSAGDISTQEARDIVGTLKKALQIPGVSIHAGVAYRHLLVWRDGPEKARTIPPHDVLGQNVGPYLYEDRNHPVQKLILSSWEILKEHAANVARRRKGLKEANSIWLWGQGRTPRLPSFLERFGLQGGVISAVDLLKGIGVCAGLEPIPVKGATGYLNTNYLGKAEEALKSLNRMEFVFVHVEAPDEAGHAGNVTEKIQAIEFFDQKVVGPVLQGLAAFDDYRVMVASDHLTPIVKKTHSEEPTPFAWASKQELESTPEGPGFSEKAAMGSGVCFETGHDLMPAFLGRS